MSQVSQRLLLALRSATRSRAFGACTGPGRIFLARPMAPKKGKKKKDDDDWEDDAEAIALENEIKPDKAAPDDDDDGGGGKAASKKVCALRARGVTQAREKNHACVLVLRPRPSRRTRRRHRSRPPSMPP